MRLTQGVQSVVRCKIDAGINADPIEGTFVINIGDMMSLWTNGMYRSTPHRVLRPSAEDCPLTSESRDGGTRCEAQRLSVPFFFEPNYDAFIEPLALDSETATVTPGRPRGITYGQYLVSKTNQNFDFSGGGGHKL